MFTWHGPSAYAKRYWDGRSGVFPTLRSLRDKTTSREDGKSSITSLLLLSTLTRDLEANSSPGDLLPRTGRAGKSTSHVAALMLFVGDFFSVWFAMMSLCAMKSATAQLDKLTATHN
jgi:hypothetical protein